MKECQNIEFKETWSDDYLKWICGFANAQGGKLYIGVDDSENIVGVKNAKKLLEDIPNKIVTTLGIVAEVFYRAGFIESWGRGIRKIVDGVKNAGLAEPKIEDADGGVRITIFRKGFVPQGVAQGVPQGVPQDVPQGLSDMQYKILECIRNNPKVSWEKIAEHLGVSKKTVARNIANMKNYVLFVGRGYSGHWQIISAGDMEKQQK